MRYVSLPGGNECCITACKRTGMHNADNNPNKKGEPRKGDEFQKGNGRIQPQPVITEASLRVDRRITELKKNGTLNAAWN